MSGGGGSNVYGLDFLRREHTLEDDGTAKKARAHTPPPEVTRTASLSWADVEAMAAAVAHKSDLEKQFDVIHFLQAHRSAGCLAPSVIYQRTGIDLHESEAVALNLQNNPKIRVEHVPDPENPSLMIATYAYQSKYNHVRDRTTLLAQINRCKNGVARRDLEDAYDGAEKDLDALICAGDVLALTNTEDKDKILFPRGDPFLVELDGIVVIPTKRRKVLKSSSSSKKDKDSKDTKDSSNGNKKTSGSGNSQKDSKTGTDNDDKSKDADKDTKESSNGDKDKEKDSKDSKSKEDSDTKPTSSKSSDAAAAKPATETTSSSPTKSSSETTTGTTTTTSPLTTKKKKSGPVYIVDVDIDPRSQVRRGEAIQIGGQWFRVSSAVKEGAPLKDQPARAQAPLSVVSLSDLSKRNEQDGYIRPLSERSLPLDASLSQIAIDNIRKAKDARDKLHKYAHGGRSGGVVSQMFGSHAHSSNPTTLAASFGSTAAASANSRKRPNKQIHSSHGGSSGGVGGNLRDKQNKQDTIQKAQEAAMDPALSLYTHARRHGCTKDVREMYLATRKHIPEMDSELHNLLLEHKLLEPGEMMRRPRLQKKANVDNDGKPKKRRYYERKNQRMTNTHLEGTEIGAVLRRATEKQKQGESVGDGGM